MSAVEIRQLPAASLPGMLICHYFKETIAVSAHLPHRRRSVSIVVANINILLRLARHKIILSTICFPSLLLSVAFLAYYISINGGSCSKVFAQLSTSPEDGAFNTLVSVVWNVTKHLTELL